MFKAGGAQEFGQGVQRIVVETGHARGLVRHDQSPLAQGVLGRDARGAIVGVAASGLDATHGEHKAPRGHGVIGSDGKDPAKIIGGDQLATGAELDPVAQPGADQGVVNKAQRFVERRAHVIGEFDRRGARAPLPAVHHDEIGGNSHLQHRLDDGQELIAVAERHLHAHRLAG